MTWVTGPSNDDIEMSFGSALPFELLDDSQPITALQEGQTMTFTATWPAYLYQGHKHLSLCLK